MPESLVASTYLSIFIHIIFATKHRAPTIQSEWRGDLHAYIGGTVRGLGATPLAVGGVADHVHVLAGIKATHAVADLVRETKKASSMWAATKQELFAWQGGYAALSLGFSDVDRIRSYIGNQEEHHRSVSSTEELLSLLAEHGVDYDPQFFE